jgi:hypothetical protein
MYFRVLNTSTDAGSVDVYLTAETDDLDSATAVASDVGGGKSTSFGTVDSGTYRLRITAQGDTSTVLLDVSNVTVEQQGRLQPDRHPDHRWRAGQCRADEAEGRRHPVHHHHGPRAPGLGLPGGPRGLSLDTTLTSGNASPRQSP